MASYDISFTSVNLPTNSGGASVTVEEDPDTDGTFENSDTVSLSDGTTSYTTSDVFNGSGNIRLDFSLGPPSNVTVTSAITFPVDVVSSPSQPQNVSLAYNADNQLTLTWDETSNWGGETGNYNIDISRDGATYVNPSGGSTSVSGGSASYSKTYGPNSDSSYDQQVGIDSSFKIRVNAENSAGTSSWVESGTVYTTPIPPHNPSVSRPDATSISISWTNQANNENGIEVQYREDTGSGYGTWTTTTTTTAGATSYSTSSLPTDVRRQWRIRTVGSGGKASVWVYADYGNDGNVYFEDDFEDNDLAEWTATSGAGTYSGGAGSVANAADTGIGGADSGTYYAAFDAEGYIEKDLGDLSGENDVIIKCALASGSLDNSTENTEIQFYDGSVWQTLVAHSHEYNEQGWTEVSALVPSSYLNTSNKVRVIGTGGLGGGDQHAVDRIVISDILNEYTLPAAPSGLSLDTSVEDEITASWTDNASLEYNYRVEVRETGGTYSKYDVLPANTTSETITNREDGESYDVRVRSQRSQDRHGTFGANWWNSSWISGTAVTLLPAHSNVSADRDSDYNAYVTWTREDDSPDGSQDVERSSDGGSTWTDVVTGLPVTDTAYTDQPPNDNTTYDYRVERNTDHATTTSPSDSVYIPYLRYSTLNGDGTITTTRDVSKQRTTQINGDGEISTSRLINKSRSIVIGNDGSITSTSHTIKDRSTSNYVTPYIQSIQTLQPVFPSEEALDVSWDFLLEYDAFVTEWLKEEEYLPDNVRNGIGLVFNGHLNREIEVFLEYDITGDGEVDYASDTVTISRAHETVAFRSHNLFGNKGWYRIGVRGLRRDDLINQVDLGELHRNL